MLNGSKLDPICSTTLPLHPTNTNINTNTNRGQIQTQMATGSHQLLNQPLHIFRQQHQTQMTPLDEILVFVRRVFWVIHMSQMAFGPCCSSFHFDI